MTSAATSSDVVHARAPGKINVSLTVGALQEDGYHDVATAYQAVSLYEDVYATRSDGFSVEFGGSIDTSHLTTGADNLAVRAARLLARSTGYRGGVHLRIEKDVPIAGGMGGGSADAAATLLACDTLWGTERTRDQLLALGAELGADVPFALAGGTAIGTGRGDRLSPALAKGTFQWVLAIAEFGVSTPDVYGELDRHRERHAQDIFPAQQIPQACCRRCGRGIRTCSPRSSTTTSRRRRSTSRPASARCCSSARRTARSRASSRDPAPRSRSSRRTSTARSSCRSR